MCRPYQYAVPVPLRLAPRQGLWLTRGERASWRLRLHSPGARSLSLQLEQAALPAGAVAGRAVLREHCLAAVLGEVEQLRILHNLIDRRAGDDLERGERFLADVDLDLLVIQPAVAEQDRDGGVVELDRAERQALGRQPDVGIEGAEPAGIDADALPVLVLGGDLRPEPLEIGADGEPREGERPGDVRPAVEGHLQRAGGVVAVKREARLLDRQDSGLQGRGAGQPQRAQRRAGRQVVADPVEQPAEGRAFHRQGAGEVPRILAHRCSNALECNGINKPSCAWCGTNPNYRPM